MKKVEIKKEKKHTDISKTKKIDDLYGKKISAIKKETTKKSASVVHLHAGTVSKKSPAHLRSKELAEKTVLSEKEVAHKVVKKSVTPKAESVIAKKSAKPLMNDMLPVEEREVVSEIADLDKENLWEIGKAVEAEVGMEEIATVEEAAVEDGGMTKDEMLGRLSARKVEAVPMEEKSEAEAVVDDVDEDAAIVAMREEIKNKMREKAEAEKKDLAAGTAEIVAEKKESKSFWSRFSFGKKKSINPLNEDVRPLEKVKEIESADSVVQAGGGIEKKEDVLADLSDQEKVAIEKKATRDNLIVAFLVFVIMVTLGATAFYFYIQYRKPGIVPNVALSSAEQAKKDADATKNAIGDIMELPDDEEPILATVTDVAKVKNQKFFANAQNGDRVLIYTLNKKAILFRPATNKIIEVNQVSGLDYSSNSAPAENVKKDASPDGEQSAVETSVKVAIYNGSKTKGLAQKISDMLTSISGIAIGEKTNATGEYDKTAVIDLSGQQADMAQRIAEALNAEIISLPEGERKPAADILVIGGSDFKITE